MHNLGHVVHTLVLLESNPAGKQSRLVELFDGVVKSTNDVHGVRDRTVIRKRHLVLVLLVEALGVLLGSLFLAGTIFRDSGLLGLLAVAASFSLLLLAAFKVGGVAVLAVTEIVSDDAELPEVVSMRNGLVLIVLQLVLDVLVEEDTKSVGSQHDVESGRSKAVEGDSITPLVG